MVPVSDTMTLKDFNTFYLYYNEFRTKYAKVNYTGGYAKVNYTGGSTTINYHISLQVLKLFRSYM